MSLFPAVLAAQATQIVTPHNHGSGQLDFVLSETGFSLTLKVPSMDIVGFEAPAASDDERTQVAIAISELSKPLNLFVVPSEAMCFTTSANVILTHEITDQGTAGDASKGVSDESHAEFQADYVIQCQDLSAVNSLDLAYFERFSGTEKLTVRIASNGTTQFHETTRATPRLSLP
ncbi:DUF2796 domain-containing protein [Ruegeria sp. 6PALISEP08]|uniref:ZrgA family zinc uptake protein n=1 Tax=Ruegeria sp. 6PALISEP08 TaxID=1225660 RepID=UPI00155D9FB1|nr:DUF2796 domain-containing protein [Ruegeria sp. 6PALISEP08]